jgi:hypothetical protein
MIKCFKISIVIFLASILGCSQDDTIEQDCIGSLLENGDMVAYTGQEIGCNNFLTLYHFENKQYFLLDSYCANIVAYPVDCEGNTLCKNREDSKCKKFYNKAERIRIVGISE